MSNYYQPGNVLSRSSSGHIAYSPSHWKSYVIDDIHKQPKNIKVSRFSQRGGSPQNSVSHLVYEPVPDMNDEKARKK